MIRARFLFLASLTSLYQGCTEPTQVELKEVPMPILAEETTLRVVRAINPRFPRFDEAQLETLLAEASRISREHFGIKVKFSVAGEIRVDKLFNAIPNKFWRIARDGNYYLGSSPGDTERLARTFGEALAEAGDPIDDLVGFDRTRLRGVEGGKGYSALGRELARIQLEGLQRWSKVTASDGKSVINSDPYSRLTFWEALGQSGVPYDVVITNQLVASAEYGSVEVHSALRGGMSQGLTGYNRDSALGTYTFVSTFAMTAGDSWVLELRGGERYSKREMAELLAYVLAHEIGHQLLHFGHPFGKSECVMNPTYQLKLRRWVQNLSARDCMGKKYAAMAPGARKITYYDWSQYP